MTIVRSIKNYIETCPLLTDKTVNLNYLGKNPVCYSIESVPEAPIVRRYCDGGSLRQYCFDLASREAYDQNELANMEVCEFFENFAGWIEEQNSLGNLPDLSEKGLTSEKIEVLKSGYLYDTTLASARFQIRLRLLYKQ